MHQHNRKGVTVQVAPFSIFILDFPYPHLLIRKIGYQVASAGPAGAGYPGQWGICAALPAAAHPRYTGYGQAGTLG